jgi:hypothetical protein
LSTSHFEQTFIGRPKPVFNIPPYEIGKVLKPYPHVFDFSTDRDISPKFVQETPKLIEEVCEELKTMLLAKNRRYGDSAIHPVRIFSKADPLEQIRIRIDDKISRVISNQDDEDEDVLDDLLGYLVLYKIAKKAHS